MQSSYSPEARLAELTQNSIGFILIMGAVLFPVLEFMDYFVMPEKFVQFMIYRLAASSLLVLLYFLNKLKRNKAYQYTIASLGAAFSAITVELAVLQSGGQNSTYYAAMMILTICCMGFAPINLAWSFFLIGLVYTIYLVPIMIIETIPSGVFISNNTFLISTFVIGLLLRYNNQKTLISELNLRAELFEDKRKLELYSSSLKNEVAEKSGALAITELKYRALFESANDGIAVLDPAGAITDVNQRFCELHGFDRDSVLGTNFRLLEIENPGGAIDDRMKRILAGESLVYEAEHYRRDGSRVLLEISSRSIDIGGVLHIQSFHRDITEKMKLQEQVLQSQKMESMGLLAGGIAHDFKNVLTGILAHAEVLRRHITTDDFGKRRIKTIEDAAQRAGQMIAKLLSFARKESLKLVPSDLNMIVMDCVELLGRAVSDQNIRIQVKLDPDIPAVYGDAIHLEQVITNLVMNAMDAMPSGGTIAIETRELKLTPESVPVSPFLGPGTYVVLSVTDSGIGIPREIMDRIFDPFFTTKPPGKGTGLGLAMVYGIVKSHRGEIRVESKENKRTRFEIYLPVPEQAPHCIIDDFLAAGIAADRGILVVDDQKESLSFISELLEQESFRVFTADTPEQALDLFHAHADRIEVVLTDIVMPLMNGTELAYILKGQKPTLRVIGMSAYDGREILKRAHYIDWFLKKPFDGDSLLETVRAAMTGVKDDAR
jgi:PAS domain S-box-containing protein